MSIGSSDRASSDFYVAHYKGFVRSDEPEDRLLLTMVHPVTGTPLTRENYVQAVRDFNVDLPQLVQNVARAMALALLASRERRQRAGNPVLIGGDGCMQAVGGQPMNGAQIMHEIWTKVVPRELLAGLSDPQVQDVSTCTLEEVRLLLRRVSGPSDTMTAVTHEYHAPRVAKVFGREVARSKFPDMEQPRVMTPEDIVAQMSQSDDLEPEEQFAADVVRAATPSAEFSNRERRNERLIYAPLSAVSTIGEILTVGRFSLELWLAERMRK